MSLPVFTRWPTEARLDLNLALTLIEAEVSATSSADFLLPLAEPLLVVRVFEVEMSSLRPKLAGDVDADAKVTPALSPLRNGEAHPRPAILLPSEWGIP